VINAAGNFIISGNLTAAAGQPCIRIRDNAANVTIDGNGRTLTTSGGGDAIEIADHGSGTPHHITISDFSSNGGVTVYGNSVHHVTIENVSVSDVYIAASDDVTVRDSTIGAGGISSSNNDTVGWTPLRTQILNNTITGGSTSVKILLEVIGGRDHPCPRVDTVISGNDITNTRNDPPPEATAAVRVRCATHVTFADNTVRSTGTTIGLYMRDEADDGIYENNTFWTNTQEAIRIASGNEDKTFPSRNLFRNNLFKSDSGDNTFFQGIGNSNRFEYNVFWSYGGGLWNQNDNNIYDHNTFYLVAPNTPVGALGYNESVPDTWTNNVISVASGPIFGYDAPWSFANYIGNYNLFHNRGGSVSFGNPAGSLAAWRSASGNTDDINSIEADPLFVNPSAGDFTLQAGSPARGAGASDSDIGAKPYGSSPPPACYENWQCTAWSACTDGTQTRTCTDLNACGTTLFRPALTQDCGCTEQWQCTAWSACANETQARTCTDLNNCGTTASRPALSQACSGSTTACGAACTGCNPNRILGPACATPGRVCDGTNTIEDIRLSAATVTAGQSLTAEVDYACYAGDDNLAVWYYNGTSWSLIQAWAQGTLTGCDATAGLDGTVSTSFMPDNNEGTHYVRVIEAAGTDPGDGLASDSQCPNVHWGEVADMSFTVQSTGGCTENWQCTDWSVCADAAQSRTCIDLNTCGTTNNQPSLTQSCTAVDAVPPDAVNDLRV